MNWPAGTEVTRESALLNTLTHIFPNFMSYCDAYIVRIQISDYRRRICGCCGLAPTTQRPSPQPPQTKKKEKKEKREKKNKNKKRKEQKKHPKMNITVLRRVE